MTTKEALSPHSDELIWGDALLLGDPAMDDDHHQFVDLLWELTRASDQDLPQRFSAFAQHAAEHFERENGWMIDSEFPPRQCHIDEHEAVMKSVREVQQLVDSGDRAVVRRLAAQLTTWFPAHLQHLDSALSHWLCKRRWGGKPVILRRSDVAASTPAE